MARSAPRAPANAQMLGGSAACAPIEAPLRRAPANVGSPSPTVGLLYR